MQLIYAILFVFTLSHAFAGNIAGGGERDKITVIVNNGEATLVEVDANGTILREIMDFPEYFELEADHETRVAEAIKKYEELKKRQIDQIRFIAFDEGFSELDENAMKHLEHVAKHYHQTYANQVVITLAVREDNQVALNKLLQDITFVLGTLGVDSKDMDVIRKQDKSSDALQFVKVQSRMK